MYKIYKKTNKVKDKNKGYMADKTRVTGQSVLMHDQMDENGGVL